jgi:hypothetical protein
MIFKKLTHDGLLDVLLPFKTPVKISNNELAVGRCWQENSMVTEATSMPVNLILEQYAVAVLNCSVNNWRYHESVLSS